MALGFDEMKSMSYSRQKTTKKQTKFPSMQIAKLVLEGRLDHTEAAFSKFECSFHFKIYSISDSFDISCELSNTLKSVIQY